MKNPIEEVIQKMKAPFGEVNDLEKVLEAQRAGLELLSRPEEEFLNHLKAQRNGLRLLSEETEMSRMVRNLRGATFLADGIKRGV